MRGRKPKPPELRQRTNAGPPPLEVPDAPHALAAADIPPWLGEIAAAEWTRILAAEDVLTKTDRAALAAYCVAWERWSAAEQQVQKHGQMVRLREDAAPRTNPYIAIAHQEHDRMVRLASEMRLTPVSRIRTPVAKKRGVKTLSDAPVLTLPSPSRDPRRVLQMVVPK